MIRVCIDKFLNAQRLSYTFITLSSEKKMFFHASLLIYQVKTYSLTFEAYFVMNMTHISHPSLILNYLWNYIIIKLSPFNCVILWCTQHAKMTSGTFSRLLSSRFSKQRQRPFDTPNARSIVTLANERALLNFF